MSDAKTPAELDEWLDALAAELGVDLTGMPVGVLLDLARDVAHNVVRPAAPLSAFVVGLAAADGGPDAVRAAAEKASAFALRWPETHGASGASASADNAPGASGASGDPA
jgi:hypothetical protein